MPKQQQQSSGAFKCPVCPKISGTSIGLTGHVRMAHRKHYQKYGISRAPEPGAEVGPPAGAALDLTEEPVTVELIDLGEGPAPLIIERPLERGIEAAAARQHPQTLIAQAAHALQERLIEVRGELDRLTALKAEETALVNQIDALGLAQKAFEVSGG